MSTIEPKIIQNPASGESKYGPSAKVIRDALGRELTIRELDPADQLDLFEACGSNASNGPWVGMALLVCSVVAIDGNPTMTALKPQHVKAMARRLGKEGVAAVAAELNAEEDQGKSAEAEVTAKN